jgi:acetyltransferase-like isoleucine patch superfamily enzyme
MTSKFGKLIQHLQKMAEGASVPTIQLALAHRRVRLIAFRRLKLIVKANSVVGLGRLRIGLSWINTPKMHGYFSVRPGGIVQIDGHFGIYSGCKIDVFEHGHITFGSGYMNSFARIQCFSDIRIGDDCAIGENFTAMDSDQHNIIGQDNEPKPIRIGSRVWIGANVTILKGVSIGDGAVIGAGSLVTKNVRSGKLAVGNPAREIRDIVWN